MGNADLSNREFERQLRDRVQFAVEADPDLTDRHESLQAARWLEWALKSLLLLPLSPAIYAVWCLTRFHGELNPAVLMAANLAGTFLPLCALGGLWRVLTGVEVLASLPRTPTPDRLIFQRAWRRHSLWSWRISFLCWLFLYAWLLWYGKNDYAWAWLPFIAALQAVVSMALCSVVSLVNHALNERLIQLHVLWLVLGLAAILPATMQQDLMLKSPQLVSEVNGMLLANFGTQSLVGSETGYFPYLAPSAWILLCSLVVHGACGWVHGRLHPLARLGMRGDPDLEVEEQSDTVVGDWCLSNEHTQFWSRRGLVEKALWGLTNRRERLALEGIANAPLNLTWQWIASLSAVFVGLGTAWILRLMNSNWSILPVTVAAMTAVAFVVVPPVISRQRFGGNLTVMQNPFPFLPVSARELYFALIKATIIKAGLVMPHILLFFGYLHLTRDGFHWKDPGYHGELILVLWVVTTAVGTYVAIAPMLVQSNVMSLKRVQGWVVLTAYLFLIAAPLMFFAAFVSAGSSGWILTLAPIFILVASAKITFWMWEEGTYDFTGIPLVSNGIEQMSPSNFSTAKSVD